MLQLFDMLMLTDASGLLTGEERVTVQGVNVAIQRETLRQRQIEFLTATNNPTDQKIMGIKGRAVVLRSVSTTIGMPGEEIVPAEDQIDKMMQAEKQAQASGSGEIDAAVHKAVTMGVEAGVKRITTELTAGVLAARGQMPEGPPTHIGTPAGSMSTTNNPGMDLGQQGQHPNDGTRLRSSILLAHVAHA